MNNVMDTLSTILEQRKQADPDNSYVASLHHKGLNKILEKVGEEATEVIIAAKDTPASGSTDELIKETADLWFHTMVLLSHLNASPNEVLTELEKRFDVSGLEEKASRSTRTAN